MKKPVPFRYVPQTPLSQVTWCGPDDLDRAPSDFWRAVYEGDPDATPNEFVGLRKVKVKR